MPSTWTVDEIKAFGTRIDGVTACKIVYGVGRTKAYEMLRLEQCDFKVTKVPGSRGRYVVSVKAVLEALDISTVDFA